MDVCFETPGVPPPGELLLSNENYCDVTISTKIPIFSVVNDVFPCRYETSYQEERY